MATKDQRYTIEIFMRNRDYRLSESPYIWRNSNCGLYKVYSNLNEKHSEQWDFFVARRKTTNEIVDTCYNTFSYPVPAIKLFLEQK